MLINREKTSKKNTINKSKEMKNYNLILQKWRKILITIKIMKIYSRITKERMRF